MCVYFIWKHRCERFSIWDQTEGQNMLGGVLRRVEKPRHKQPVTKSEVSGVLCQTLGKFLVSVRVLWQLVWERKRDKSGRSAMDEKTPKGTDSKNKRNKGKMNDKRGGY